MNAFFVLYALTISLELMLSILMAIFVFLILVPTGGDTTSWPTEPKRERPLARTIEGALGDVIATVSEGRDDLTTLTNARSLLQQYARERREGDRSMS